LCNRKTNGCVIGKQMVVYILSIKLTDTNSFDFFEWHTKKV